MTPTLLTVTYELRIPPFVFLDTAGTAAESIARTPGLIWKIWGLDDGGNGTSVYLFRSRPEAEAFATGPALDTLRAGPARAVRTRIAPVDAELSRITRAGPALAEPA